MPRYFKSTANKPGSGVRKGYRRGGRNLRDEEARVIGVQDNAADELRRVRARRPHDAAERRDRRAQLARVGSRERNARDEMRRLRGYQMGGGIDSLPRPLIGLESMKQPRLAPGQGFITPGPRQAMDFSGSPLLQQQLQQRLAAQQATGPTGPIVAMPRPGEPPRTLRPAPSRYVPDQTGTPLPPTPWPGMKQGVTFDEYVRGLPGFNPIRPNPPPTDPQFLARMVANQKNPVLTPFEFAQEEQRLGNPNFDVTGRVNPATGQIPRPRADFGAGVAGGARPPAGITPIQRGASATPWFSSTQRPEYLPDQEAQQFFPWARGGRVSLKTGGRIPRKKKGAKFI